MNEQHFKLCPNCNNVWIKRALFLSDKTVQLNGYTADFEKLEYGLFFFTHHRPDCFSTMAIEVAEFMDLYTGVIHKERKTGGEECPRYCLDKDQLERCDAVCECAFVREILQTIRNWNKQ